MLVETNRMEDVQWYRPAHYVLEESRLLCFQQVAMTQEDQHMHAIAQSSNISSPLHLRLARNNSLDISKAPILFYINVLRNIGKHQP